MPAGFGRLDDIVILAEPERPEDVLEHLKASKVPTVSSDARRTLQACTNGIVRC
jgi:ABC-type hemin transport system substrate-binding protein